jgi:hypothetical protein
MLNTTKEGFFIKLNAIHGIIILAIIVILLSFVFFFYINNLLFWTENLIYPFCIYYIIGSEKNETKSNKKDFSNYFFNA